ncbi:hypothetical protein QIH96_13000 [Bradyrhizobium japonicum]|uniref:hypothetical protein n=1 Tax=Bradyrhizobium japonicum TaxID=375 RepID=UPI0027146063|nr:hypothetical protein [Bradyrhizobium japonicum]WLB66018.1 hypothetical protein QIH96_13000 [Bradyrhizobium japonicum]
MAEYQLTASDAFVIRTADQASIPNDDLNHDWQVYQQWLADGGVPDPVPPTINPALDNTAIHGPTASEILGAEHVSR